MGAPTITRVSVKPGGLANGAQEFLLTALDISDVTQAVSFVITCAITQVAFPDLDYESCKQYIGFALNNVI